jgi:hypothetical protein
MENKNTLYHFTHAFLIILIAIASVQAEDCNTVKELPKKIVNYLKLKHPTYWIPTVGQYRKRGQCLVDTLLIKAHRDANPSCVEVDLNGDGKKDYAVCVLYDDSLFNRNLDFIVLMENKKGSINEKYRHNLSSGSSPFTLEKDSLGIRLGFLAGCKFKQYHHGSEADTTYEVRTIPKNGFLVYGDCGSNGYFIRNDSLIDERFTDCY